MIPSPYRSKGSGPQLGASKPGAPGPFGVRPDVDGDEPDEDAEPDVDDGVIFADRRKSLVDEPEPTSHVDAEVQRRIAEARVRIQAAKARRESLAEARRHGLARRHAQRMRNLRDAEQRRHEAEQQQGDQAR